jgi:hypothetical protein
MSRPSKNIGPALLAKSESALTEAQASRTTLPRKPRAKKAPALTASTVSEVVKATDPTSTLVQSDALVPVSVLHVTDEARVHIAEEAASSVATALFHGYQSSVAREDMFERLMTFRRMFPAHVDVQAILGPDAFDLIGRTPEYMAAAEALYGEAKTNLIGKLRRSIGRDLAETVATAQIAKLRANMTNDIRKEAEALAQKQPNPALFLLGHGYAYRTNVKTQAIAPGQTLKITRDGEGEDAPITGFELISATKEAPIGVKPGPKGTDPDAVLAKILESAGVTVGDAASILNLTIRLLNQSATLLRSPETKMNLQVRNTLRTSVMESSRDVLSALAGDPDKVPATK